MAVPPHPARISRPAPAGEQVGVRPLPVRYGQVVEIILTLSTFSCGEAAADEADDCPSLAGLAAVPVISTLCPTCGLSFASVPTRRYSLAVAPVDEDVPAVPAVPAVLELAGLDDTFFNTNFVWSAALVPEVPVAPVAGVSARSTQPVTVMLFADAAPVGAALRCLRVLRCRHRDRAANERRKHAGQ